MSKLKRNRRQFNKRSMPGTAPGTLHQHENRALSIQVIAYGPDRIEEASVASIKEAVEFSQPFQIVWIDITGLGNLKLLREFGKEFTIHNLTLEDIVNVHQRAKFESFENYNYFVTRMVCFQNGFGEHADTNGSAENHAGERDFQSEQLSILHCGKFVISFQEFEGDCLEPLRNRLRKKKGNVRERRSDYLVYAIIDTVLDHYFPIVDRFGERLDEQDALLISGSSNFSLAEIHRIRSQLLDLGRWLRPNREMINQILRDESSSMSEETQVFMRDCYDHVIQLYEAIEMYREVCSDLRDYHLSAVGNRTNDVMKILTIVSTIFIPLGFIAGLYGMNFQYMPELNWRFGYFAVLGLMFTIVASFLCWFNYRGWFGK